MRLLHTMLRVGDLQHTIDFYTKALEMRLLRISENPEYKYTLAFVGYTDEREDAVIELTYKLGCGQCGERNACERIFQVGGKVIRNAGPVKGGATVISFIEDLDGYKIELIENKHAGQSFGNISGRDLRFHGRYSALRGHNSPCKPPQNLP